MEMRIDSPDLPDDQTVLVEIVESQGSYQLSFDGENLDAQILSHCRGELDLLLDGHRLRAWVADAGAVAAGNARQVFIDGRVVTVRLPSDDDDVVDVDVSGGPNIVAEMPGKIVKVLVTEGQRVEPGQGTIIIESMKMETEIAAAVAGSVAVIHVEAGRTVGQGEVLLEITPDDEIS